MVETPAASLYDGCFAYVTAEKKYYSYDSTNQEDVTLGKWREYSSGGGGGTTYTAGDGIDITNDVISTEKSQSGDMDEIVDVLPNGGIIIVTGYTPLGTILSYFGETAPKFYLACDGTAYNKSDYPELANHLLSLTNHSQYEVDGDSTKFKVPDLRGEFLRGTGTATRNTGSGGNVGTHQDGSRIPIEVGNTTNNRLEIRGVVDGSNNIAIKDGDRIYTYSDVTSPQKITFTNGSTSAMSSGNVYATTRPTNTSVLQCIAYKDIHSNPMNDYSTNEKVVGTWIDGKPIYQKTIDCGALPNATTKTVDTNITNANQLIDWTGCVGNTGKMVLPRIFKDNADVMVTFSGDLSHMVIKTESNRSSLNAYITVQYTKTTD